MTNEEAIPWLKGVLTFYRGNGYYDTQRREALKIAIKALERPQGEIIKELWNCRNELCLKCERYKEAWNGACEDCRYNIANMQKWKEGSDEVADDKHL